MPEFVCTSNGDRTLIGQGSNPHWSGGDCSLQWRPLVSGVLCPDWPRRTMGPSGGREVFPLLPVIVWTKNPKEIGKVACPFFAGDTYKERYVTISVYLL